MAAVRTSDGELYYEDHGAGQPVVFIRGLWGQLSVTPKTARNYIERIYTKIGVSTRSAATLFATRHGLV
jgi:hypothetical protein